MTFSSSLSDDSSTTLVIDTSVLINLQGCEFGREIIDAIGNPFVITWNAVAEFLNQEGEKQRKSLEFLDDLNEMNLLEIVYLTQEEDEFYRRFTCAEVNLDDGEAATIGVAISREFLPVIDERAGREYAVSLFPFNKIPHSMDIFFHRTVKSHFDEETFRSIIFNALYFGKMNISLEHREYVVELIGRDRAKECTCLPKYKELMKQWTKEESE